MKRWCVFGSIVQACESTSDFNVARKSLWIISELNFLIIEGGKLQFQDLCKFMQLKNTNQREDCVSVYCEESSLQIPEKPCAAGIVL